MGRGQRQLLIGDRFTGKTSIYITSVVNQNRINFLKSTDGFGSKRLFGVYVGLNQNLSRIYKVRYICEKFTLDSSIIILATHTTSPSMLSYTAPYSGLSACEYLRDNG